MKSLSSVFVMWAILLTICLAADSAPAAGLLAEDRQLRIEEFGVKLSPPISNGFVFVDWVYLDNPYIVSRRGLAVFVNNTMIYDSTHLWPPRDVLVNDEPGYPAGLDTNSSFADISDNYKDTLDKPVHKQYRYAHQHFPQEEACRKIKEWFEGLPFVTGVHAKSDGLAIVVTTNTGKKRQFSVGRSGDAYGVIEPMTKEIVLRDLEYVRAQYEDRIDKGDCFFMFSSGVELSLGSLRAKQKMPDILDALRVEEPPSNKVQRLKNIGLLPPAWTVSDLEFVDKFQTTPQLEDRVRQIRGEKRKPGNAGSSRPEVREIQTETNLCPGIVRGRHPEWP